MREVGGAVNVTQGKQPQSLACCPTFPVDLRSRPSGPQMWRLWKSRIWSPRVREEASPPETSGPPPRFKAQVNPWTAPPHSSGRRPSGLPRVGTV